MRLITILLLFFCLLLSSIFITGCGTARGVASGVESTASGMVEDTTNICGGIMAADNWVKENLW